MRVAQHSPTGKLRSSEPQGSFRSRADDDDDGECGLARPPSLRPPDAAYLAQRMQAAPAPARPMPEAGVTSTHQQRAHVLRAAAMHAEPVVGAPLADGS